MAKRTLRDLAALGLDCPKERHLYRFLLLHDEHVTRLLTPEARRQTIELIDEYDALELEQKVEASPMVESLRVIVQASARG